MLNMLIGILCEVVCATGEGERARNLDQKVREAITELFNKIDKDHNGEITREEFMSMRGDKNVMDALKELQVKAKHFDMYAELMFKADDEGGDTPAFKHDDVIEMIMRLRPGTKVSALDFTSFQMTVHNNHDSLKKKITSIEKLASVLTRENLDTSAADPSTQTTHEDTAGKISAGAAPQLETMPDIEILNELQYRVGNSTFNVNMPSPVEPDLQTYPDVAWSKELFTC